jgi:IMP dehydrogenase/GMP reductase
MVQPSGSPCSGGYSVAEQVALRWHGSCPGPPNARNARRRRAGANSSRRRRKRGSTSWESCCVDAGTATGLPRCPGGASHYSAAAPPRRLRQPSQWTSGDRVFETRIGGARTARIGYELEDVALVPSRRTRDEELVDVSWQLDAYRFELPVLGAPLDAVVSPTTAGLLSDLGSVGVLSLEGLWTRYEDPEDVLAEIASLEPGPRATVRLQQLYAEPVKEELIGRRVEELKAGGLAAGSLTPQKVERYHHAALDAGLDLLVVHGVTVTAQHVGLPDTEPLDLRSFTARYDIPVIVGGVASAKSALHLMRTGAVGVLVGIGASSVSTTQSALGIHVPMATAIAEVAAAAPDTSRSPDATSRDRRRQHPDRWRPRQGHRLWGGCGDARPVARRRRRGARPGGVLGARRGPSRAASGALRPGRVARAPRGHPARPCPP